jgi:hypothetical protein
MKNLMKIFLAGVMLSFSLNILAKDAKCDNTSTCVDSNYFVAEVKKISYRGNTLIAQVQYKSKINFFDADFKNGYALILDSNGNEFRVDGKNISSFRLGNGKTRVLSLRFKGGDKSSITAPFDLTIKASKEHGEITFFDLNTNK